MILGGASEYSSSKGFGILAKAVEIHGLACQSRF